MTWKTTWKSLITVTLHVHFNGINFNLSYRPLTLKASVVAFTAQVEDVGSSSKTKAECFVKDRKDSYAYKCILILCQLPFIIIEDILGTNLWLCMNTRFSHFFAWKMMLRNHATNTILDFLTTIPKGKKTTFVVVFHSLYFANIR